MRIKVTARRANGQQVDLTLTADATANVVDLAQALARADTQLLPPGTQPDAVTLQAQNPDGSRQRILRGALAVSDAGLQSGAAIALVPSSEHFDLVDASGADAAVRLRVVRGTDVGLDVGLPLGTSTVGRAGTNDVVLADPMVSKQHAKITVTDAAVEVLDRGSANGVLVGDGFVERAVVGPSDVIELGDTAIQLERLPRQAGEAVASNAFNRSPRVAPRYVGEETQAPGPPEPAKPYRFPMLAMIAPMIMGGALYYFTRNPMSLIFVALSPMMMLGNYIDNRSTEKTRLKRETKDYVRALESLRTGLAESTAAEEEARRREVPATAALMDAGLCLRPLLWSRRPEHGDFLHLNLGLGTAPARNTVKLPHRGSAPAEQWDELTALVDAHRLVENVPIVADLTACGAIGVAGPRATAGGVARSLMVQLATLHSPAEVVLAGIASSASAGWWEWMKWLPHVASQHSPIPGSHLASSPPAGSSLVSRIEGLIEERQKASRSTRTRWLPAVVLLVEDDAPVERGRLVHLAERGPDYGVHVVWVADRQENLPAVCRTFVRTAPDVGAEAGFVTDGTLVTGLRAETAEPDAVAAVARRLAPVTDAGAPTLDESDLPRSVSYLSLAGPEIASNPGAVIDKWRENGSLVDRTAPPVRRTNDASLRALIGQGTEQEFFLDLRSQGPHALVGGTTGAGKSEFLQAWVLGLAAAHSPDRVSFLFVDYKGGAAFADCVELPHTVGLVTDLSPHLVRRALTSLRAELHRREHLLNRKKAKDLLALERTGDHETPPTLIIVVDEFAALVSEVPEFVDGVVDVAQRGRSLGLHLVLATQRPAGVIKDNLRANTPLRVALRMADESDSTDVLGDPMAGGFDPSVPGRGAVRTGPGRLAMFQAGYAGGRTSDTPPRPRIDIETLVFGPGQQWDIPESLEPLAEVPEEGPTDIARAVRTIAAAATNAHVPAPRKPWLPELSDRFDLLALRTAGRSELPLGMLDDPARQTQRTATYRPDVDGNLAIIGTSGAGKSTTLRTVVTAARLGPDPEPVQAYGLDFGSGGLAMLAGLPHVGAVVDGNDAERVARLLRRLLEELEARALRFSRARAGTLLEYRDLTGNVAEPRIYLVVDGLGAFRDAYETTSGRSALFAVFTRVLAEGRPLGMHVVVAAERPGAISTTLGSSLQRRLVLRQADEMAYSTLNVPKDILGADAPAGRAVFTGETNELQIAVVGGLEKPAEQSRLLDELAARQRAEGAPEAPDVERLAEVFSCDDLPDRLGEDPVLGLWDESLGPVPFSARGVFLLAGMPGSGRTNALQALSIALRRWSEDVRLCYFGPKRSAVRALEVWDDTATSIDEAAALARELVPLLSVPADGPAEIALVVEGLTDFLGGAAEQALAEAIKAARRGDHFVVAEGETTSWGSSWPLVAEVRNGRRGFVLQPDQVDGEAIFRTPFPRMARADFPVGRGEYVESGKLKRVHLPLV